MAKKKKKPERCPEFARLGHDFWQCVKRKGHKGNHRAADTVEQEKEVSKAYRE